ncbi:hypothetical protein PIIN_10283 [Serendipita indica DSM 11827]|uniref:Uncharacterized protein n=1 Tax=Serendipita indica (strain DSM 11827) TaxID=1109443 RepID=G4TY95_SERID|nr:hypothetical protein PIIN_10283 [Serendipita indica DSM 11827]
MFQIDVSQKYTGERLPYTASLTSLFTEEGCKSRTFPDYRLLPGMAARNCQVIWSFPSRDLQHGLSFVDIHRPDTHAADPGLIDMQMTSFDIVHEGQIVFNWSHAYILHITSTSRPSTSTLRRIGYATRTPGQPSHTTSFNKWINRPSSLKLTDACGRLRSASTRPHNPMVLIDQRNLFHGGLYRTTIALLARTRFNELLASCYPSFKPIMRSNTRVTWESGGRLVTDSNSETGPRAALLNEHNLLNDSL